MKWTDQETNMEPIFWSVPRNVTRLQSVSFYSDEHRKMVGGGDVNGEKIVAERREKIVEGRGGHSDG